MAQESTGSKTLRPPQERASFGERMAEDRARARARREEKAAQSAMSVQEATDPRLEARRATRAAAEKFRASLRNEAGEKGPKAPSSFERMSLLHQAYASNMVMGLVAPLARGASGAALMSSVGMGVALFAMSPNFRSTLGHYGTQLTNAVADKIEARRDAKLGKRADRAERKLESAEEAFEGDAQSPLARVRRLFTPETRRDHVMNAWEARIDRMADQRRGRLPFTFETAAQAHVGMAEAAFYDMRRPGADVGAVRADYEDAVSKLYQAVGEDNASRRSSPEERAAQMEWAREQTADHMRLVVAERMANEPAFGNIFAELAHGAVGPGEPRTIRDEATGAETRIPTFETVQGFGVKQGIFDVREPLDWEEHQRLFTGVVVHDMIDEQGVEAIDKVFRGYTWGLDVRGMSEIRPEEATSSEDRQRIQRIKSFFDAMDADGIPKGDQTHIYTGAITQAAALLGDANPNLSREWESKYGENWREEWTSKESGFGAYFDQRRAEEAARHEAEREQAFASGAQAFRKHTGPGADGKPVDWYEDSKGRKVAFDERTMKWGYEEDIAADRKARDEAPAQPGPAEAFVVDEEGERVHFEAGPEEMDEDIVDAEVVDEEEEAEEVSVDERGSGLFDGLDDQEAPEAPTAPGPMGPASASFEAPVISKGTGRAAARLTLVDSMSDFMARDALEPSVIGGGKDAASAARVYSNAGRALGSDSPYGADKPSNRRSAAIRAMDEAMSARGFVRAERDDMLATAYVQAMDEASLRDPSLEAWLEERAEVSGSDDWHEHEFALASRRTPSGGRDRDWAEASEELDADAAEADKEVLAAKRLNAADPVKRAADRRRRLAARVTHRRASINRTHVNQGEGIETNDQTLLDRMRDGDQSDGRERDINDPGQSFTA